MLKNGNPVLKLTDETAPRRLLAGASAVRNALELGKLLVSGYRRAL
jgi:hypothetical protein